MKDTAVSLLPFFFFLINFSLHYDIIKSEQQQTAVPCLRTGVRVAKWQCCQRGKGNWIHFKATFFLFVGKLAFFLCATSPSPPFSLIEIPGKGKHICWHFQWVILSNSSGLISCLRYVQCSHLLSSLFCSKWLFNLNAIGKKKKKNRKRKKNQNMLIPRDGLFNCSSWTLQLSVLMATDWFQLTFSCSRHYK